MANWERVLDIEVRCYERARDVSVVYGVQRYICGHKWIVGYGDFVSVFLAACFPLRVRSRFLPILFCPFFGDLVLYIFGIVSLLLFHEFQC